MKKNLLLCFLLLLLSVIASAQSASEKKLLAGTWSVMSVSYGDYYYYDMENDTLEVKEKLQNLMLQDSERYGKDFLETLRKNASEYAKSCSFTINQTETYSLRLGTKKVVGKFEYLPLQIPISSESPISDREYNEDHQDDLAFLKLSNGEYVSIIEYSDALTVYHYTNAKKAGVDELYAKVLFYIKK